MSHLFGLQDFNIEEEKDAFLMTENLSWDTWDNTKSKGPFTNYFSGQRGQRSLAK